MSAAKAKLGLIWSRYHNAWFRPEAAGYTDHIAAAGVFSTDYRLERRREAFVFLPKVIDRIRKRRAELIFELAKLDAVESALANPEKPTP